MSGRRGRQHPLASGLAAVALMVAILPLASAQLLADGVQVDAPLIVADPLHVDVHVDAPLLPVAQVGVAGLDVGTGPGRSAAKSAGPPPEPTPPTMPEATASASAQVAGAAAASLIVAAPALPWESLGAALSQWAQQAREAARPVLRPLDRFLRALPFLAPLFTRLGEGRLLENPVRARVHETITQDPGLSLQDVRDRAGVAWGTTVHHLARLERHGLVVSVRHGNHRRYFPVNTMASRHRRELSALAHPTAHAIASYVAATPGTDQKGLCEALAIRNPAASKHLGRFSRLGLVQDEVVGRSKIYHPTDLLRSALGTLASLGGLAPQATAPATLAEEPSVAASTDPTRHVPARAHRTPLADAFAGPGEVAVAGA